MLRKSTAQPTPGATPGAPRPATPWLWLGLGTLATIIGLVAVLGSLAAYLTRPPAETAAEAAIDGPDLGLFSARNEEGLGIFRITAAQHRDLWDRYLAFNPEIASRVRGLASQRAFLSDPDSELQTNLSYCTAIAWLMYQRSGLAAAEPQQQEQRATA